MIDLALAKLEQTDSVRPSVWDARVRFEREQGALTEEFYLPSREITEAAGRNPLDE